MKSSPDASYTWNRLSASLVTQGVRVTHDLSAFFISFYSDVQAGQIDVSGMYMDRHPAISPAQDNALFVAVSWVSDLLLGQIGTVIAVLAVAGIGFAMLQGRLSVRDGVRVVIGCFILFGAAGVAGGLVNLARWGSGSASAVVTAPEPVSSPPPLPAPPPVNPDPYAGASVPMR